MPTRNGFAAAAVISGALLCSEAVRGQVTGEPDAAGMPEDAPLLTLPTVEIVATSPLLGIGIDPDKLPSATHGLSARELLLEGPPDLARAMRDRLGAVTISEAQNNPFQPDLQYRGFVASPLTGTPQGLAVYQNGVRINEVLGDTVNWDVIPDRAIERANVLSANPIYGLNALGGAVVLRMKNGFTFQGGEFEVSGGSFGRVSLEGEHGVKTGRFASYVAASAINDDGWRDFSRSRVRRLYADLGAELPGPRRGDLHLSFTGADNNLTGNGATPVQMLDRRREAIFTYPDRTANNVAMLNLNGTYALSDTASVQGLTYYRRLRQRTLNGDIFDAEACDDDASPGKLCLGDDDGPVLLNQFGRPVADFLGNRVPGAFNRTITSSSGYGDSLQLTETARVFDLSNHFVIGAGYDRGTADFSASTEIGALTADRTVAGTGEIVTSADGTVAPAAGLRREKLWNPFRLVPSRSLRRICAALKRAPAVTASCGVRSSVSVA